MVVAIEGLGGRRPHYIVQGMSSTENVRQAFCSLDGKNGKRKN